MIGDKINMIQDTQACMLVALLSPSIPFSYQESPNRMVATMQVGNDMWMWRIRLTPAEFLAEIWSPALGGGRNKAYHYSTRAYSELAKEVPRMLEVWDQVNAQ